MRLMQVNGVSETLAHGKISPSVRDEVEGRESGTNALIDVHTNIIC